MLHPIKNKNSFKMYYDKYDTIITLINNNLFLTIFSKLII